MAQYPNLNGLIEDRDTKIKELAKEIGVSTKQIKRWKDGTSEMGIDKLVKICTYYSVSADYILGLPRGLEWHGDEGCKLGNFPMKSPILYTGDFIRDGHDQSGAF